MFDIWKKAKANKEILHFKNFQEPDITWQEVLDFVYQQSLIDNPHLNVEKSRTGGTVVGNILAFNGYFFIRENNMFSTFKGLTELITKVNNGYFVNCGYYNDGSGKCNCELMWHVQALRFSITDHSVSSHTDPNDVLYWQVLGNSEWIIDEEKSYILEPGDLFYFNRENYHQVKQTGPRAGFIIDNLKGRYED